MRSYRYIGAAGGGGGGGGGVHVSARHTHGPEEDTSYTPACSVQLCICTSGDQILYLH
jgi:hypothetical protein